MTADAVGRDRPPFPGVLRGAGACHRALGQPRRRRSHAAVRGRRDAAVQALPARPADPAVQAGRGRAEVRADAGHRRGRQDDQARDVLPDARQLVVRRLLQGRRDQVRLGAADPVGARRRVRLPRGEALGDRAARRRRGVRDLAGRDRRVGEPDPAPRPGRQLLAHGRARSGRPVLGDLLRPGSRVRPRGRPRGGRGPVPGDLEPGLHAGHAERGPVEGRFRHRRPAADEERRHRHGPGADGVDPAGGRQPLRDRHHLEDPRQGGRADRAGLRHRPPQRRGAAGRRRPRAQRGDADRGRGAARQRGRQLRAPPAAAPQHPQPAPAVGRAARRRRVVGRRVHARADRDHDRRDGRAVPRAAPRRGQHPQGHRRRGRGVRGHAPHRHRDLRRGGGGDQAQARQRADPARRRSSSTTPTASRST